MSKNNNLFIDALTGDEILFVGCTYTTACKFIERNKDYFDFDFQRAKIKIDSRTNRTLIYNEDNEGNIKGRVFIYDEGRKILLSD